jgi:protein TonB
MTRAVFLGAGLVSVSLHVFGASFAHGPNDVVLDGGAVAGEGALGVGFSDLVAGMETGSAITPDEAVLAQPNTLKAVATETTTPVQTQTLTQVSPPSQTARAVAPLVAVSPSTSLTAAPPHEQVASPKLTPKRRPEGKMPAAKPAKPSAKGNATVNSTKGRSDGAITGREAEGSKPNKAEKAAQAGAKVMQTYHASVFRKISRVPNRAAGAKGKARVGISITPAGSIASVQIVKSSGHAGIDKLALSQVRRAGPFAPTPTGQAVHVVVQFESKG